MRGGHAGTAAAPTPVIALSQLGRDFASGAGRVQALGAVNLQVQAGEYVAIVGPSGSGKTTLMNLLGCLDRPTRGRYLLDGVEVSALDDVALSQVRNAKIGFVFQGFHLLPRVTALENVALPLLYAGLPRPERMLRARQALTAVDLQHRLHHVPSQLSGGQCQRVAIARALVNAPALLLADEPTGSLDQSTGQEVLALLDQLNQNGTTLVVITHDPQVAKRAHRRLQMVDGHVA